MDFNIVNIIFWRYRLEIILTTNNKKMTKFTLTQDHIKLLSKTYISWNDCEYGAPEINPKRPYGNSDVIDDIAEILEIKGKECSNCGEPDYSDKDFAYMEQIHKELETALKIVLSNLPNVKLGEYEYDGYNEWSLIKEANNKEV